MANQGLFTQLPSVNDLLQQRNKRSSDLQQQLMNQAAQGARDPAKARAVSFLGSSLGRALGDSMGGDTELEERKAAIAAQKEAQGVYVDAMGAPTAAGMRKQAELLRNSYPEGAVKLLAAANAKEAQEKTEAAALAAAEAKAVKETKDAELAAQKIIDDKAAKVEEYAQAAQARLETRVEALRAQKFTAAEALAQATREAEASKKVVMSGSEWNAKNDGSLSDGSMWLVGRDGSMEQIDKPTKANVTTTVPAGYSAEYDDKGNVTKLVPVEGGKPWQDAQDATAAAAAQEEQASKTASDKDSTANVVNDAINEALNIANQDSLLTPIFGPTGALAGKLDGSQRANLEAFMKPIEAQTAFGTLAAMRAASKTGGALGAISEKELELLKAAQGALSRSQSKEQFIRNLEKFQVTYNNMINGDATHIAKWNKENGVPDVVAPVVPAPQQTGFGSGAGPNAAALPASVAKYY